MFPDLFDIFREREEAEDGVKGSGASALERGKTFAVSIGGSIIIDEKPNTSMIAKLSQSITALFNEGHKFALAVGGGRVCRNYIAAAKALGSNNFFQDEIGIAVTRINAALLVQSLEPAHPVVMKKINQAKRVIDSGKIPVYGGLLPGLTTDSVAALLAEGLNATFVNLSNVDGVYSSNPSENPHAKFYPELSYDRLASLIRLSESKPGQNVIIDLPAAMILKRSNIRAIFLNGNNLENFESALRGGEFKGTIVAGREDKVDAIGED